MKRKAPPQAPHGDELDDGLDYAVDGFDSDDGAVAVSASGDNDSDEGEVVSTTKTADSQDSGKRENSTGKSVAKAEKQRRLKEKMALKKRRRMETEVTVKKSIAAMEPAVIADYIAKKARLWHPKLSSIELDDQYLLPQSRVCDMSFWDNERSLPNFKSFLMSCTKSLDLADRKEGNRGPCVIVICISAIRVCDVRRTIPKTVKSVKIIAKNSINKDGQKLESFNPAIVLATPERLKNVVERGVLKLTDLERVIVDSSYLDSKARSVLDDVPETLTVMKRLVTDAERAQIALF
ncbi:U3-containing 90S pre-ribosomal complex subunit-domain containing protein [Lipomyces kononenkoae]|uniref:U3-containing 90S pre-ribosomal complex subunit-domain containing protein n=1 Tax=Lipomyces kononenkoae TaxID=34357 RepID=A0ACC3TB30_LIPKO